MSMPSRRLERVCWLGIASREVAAIVARAGPDACVIDREHGQIGIETMAAMIAEIRDAGVRAIVRVPENSIADIKYALDAGADGVIVPYVETVAEAEAAVAATFFPPKGRRGAAVPVIRASGYGDQADYADSWNQKGQLIVQIETHHGLTNAPDIAAVDGVDMLFFGPSDYARDAGLDQQEDSDVLLQALGQMATAARAHHRGIGAFPWPGVGTAQLVAAGADMVAVASDIVLLRQGVMDALQAGHARN